MAYLMNFNSMDGLDPRIVAKLNNNFRAIQDMLPDEEIVMVAQATPPTPRTDETLWYDTDNGKLWIWAQVIDPDTGEPVVPEEWGWITYADTLIQTHTDTADYTMEANSVVTVEVSLPYPNALAGVVSITPGSRSVGVDAWNVNVGQIVVRLRNFSSSQVQGTLTVQTRWI
jgi:hypothetical protein